MKKYISLIISLIAFVFSPFYLQAQKRDVKFEHLSIEHGLSQSSVTDIIQDSRGFMWFGTLDGLNKFDGYEITVYQNSLEDSTSIADNYITSLYEDEAENLWVGTQNMGLCIYNKIKDNFINVKHCKNQNNCLSNNQIRVIYQDMNGTLWVGTADGLNKLLPVDNSKPLTRRKFRFQHYKHDKENFNSLYSNVINDIVADQSGNLWIATDGGLNFYDIEDETFNRFNPKTETETIKNLITGKINTLFVDKDDILWLGTDRGLIKANVKKHIYNHFKKGSTVFSLSAEKITDITQDNTGALWIGTEKGGLNKLLFGDVIGGFFIQYKHDPSDSYSLSVDNVLSLYLSRNEVLWVGTSLGGINKWDRGSENIELYRHNPYDPKSLSSNQVRSIFVDSDGELWIGTVDGGLNLFDQKRFVFTHFMHNPDKPKSLSNDHVRAIEEDKNGLLWIGTDGGGINIFDRKEKKFIKKYKHRPGDEKSIGSNRVWTIYKDRRGTLWIGTYGGGLNRYNPETDDFTRYQHDPSEPGSLSNDYVTSIFEDKSGNLWVGTFGGGVNKLSKELDRFITYRHDENDKSSLGSNLIYSIIEDHQGTIWIGAKGNLNRFNETSSTFKRYTKSDGLPNNVIMGIIEDNDGNLWISTNRGLSKFNIKEEEFRNYDVNDGLQSNEFLVGAYCKGSSGKLYFGGINGLNAFFPRKIKDNPYKPQIVITGFQVYNEEVSLDTVISEKDMLNLTYKDKVISFEFVALNFIYPEKNSYAYKMENLDDEWIYAGNRRFANYTNMQPGKYEFKVIGSNSDGVWNKEGTSISIIISPPFWKTWWFYGLEILLVGVAIVSFIKLRERKLIMAKQKLEETVKERTIEISQQKEEILTQAEQLEYANKELAHANEEIKKSAKLKEMFLANTSHEIRTPLNIILGYTNLLLNSDLKKRQQAYLKNIWTSGNNLLVIINDILDFSKIEAGKLTIENIEFEFREIIKSIRNSLKVKAKEVGINFNCKVADDIPKYVFGDPVRLNQILINLGGNAIKFTEKNGRVEIKIKLLQKKADEARIKFDVSDTGIGMTKEQADKVFESFTQASSDTTRKFGGTGLGLSIVKRLVELQGGKILIDSTLHVGSTFTVIIDYPIGDGSKIQRKAAGYKIERAETLRELRILLVDDNPVNRELAIDTIKLYNSKITIDEAENGFKALDHVKKNSYDMIIMDIQMPEMDGLEATQHIRQLPPPKGNIPVLAMTAHAMKDEREKCITVGMNGYQTKPFVPEELFAKIEELTGQVREIEKPEDRKPQTEEKEREKDDFGIDESRFQLIKLAFLKKTYKGDKQKIHKILNLCYNNIPKQLKSLRQHLNDENWKGVRTISHSVKTTLNYIGLESTRDAAKTIEKNSANQTNLDTIPALVEKLEKDWETAEKEMKEIIDALA